MSKKKATKSEKKAKRVAFGDLNRKEQRVVKLLVIHGKLGLNDIARRALGVKKGSSGARNSVRRPLREGFVSRVGEYGSGTYKATRKARTAVTS